MHYFKKDNNIEIALIPTPYEKETTIITIKGLRKGREKGKKHIKIVLHVSRPEEDESWTDYSFGLVTRSQQEGQW